MKGYLKRNALYFVILFLWIVSLFLEYNGGRAASLMQDSSVFELIFAEAYTSLKAIVAKAKEFNLLCIFICVLIPTGAISLLTKNRNNREDRTLENTVLQICTIAVICGIMTVVYLYLLSLVTNPRVFKNAFVWVAFMPWLFVIVIIGLSYIQKRYNKAVVLMPTVLCIVLMVCGMYMGTFRENTAHQLPPDTCIALNLYVMDQITAADENGQSEVL